MASKRRPLLLFPFGGNAREALCAVLAAGSPWKPIGFFDDDDSTWGKECCGVRVLGGRDAVGKHRGAMILAVPGSPGTYLERRKTLQGLEIPRERFATVRHPSVVVAPDAKVGRNTLLLPNVVVSTGARVGGHCVILPNTVIAHDSEVGDYTLIGSNVTVSGHVRIGENCYIGSGANLRDNISIGARTLLGLGANAVSDIESGVVAAGNPARVMRKAAP